MKLQDRHRVMFSVYSASALILWVTCVTLWLWPNMDDRLLAPMFALISAATICASHLSVPFSTDERRWMIVRFMTTGVAALAGYLAGDHWLRQAVEDELMPYGLVYLPLGLVISLTVCGIIYVNFSTRRH